MYRQAHRKIRLWLGEDYRFSAVIRDANGIPVDLTGATATLKLEPYLGGGSTYSADLATRSDGVASVQLNGPEMYRQMSPGLYKYVVTIGLDDALLIGESGTVQAIAGYQGLTGGADVDITGLDWAPSPAPEPPDPNEPPSASFTESVENLELSVESTSTDSDGTIVSTVWSFGDGATATGTTASHTYEETGYYTVTVTVVDNDGASDSYSKSVYVSEDGCPAPEVSAAAILPSVVAWWPFDGTLEDVVGGYDLTGTAAYASSGSLGSYANPSTPLNTAVPIPALTNSAAGFTMGGRFRSPADAYVTMMTQRTSAGTNYEVASVVIYGDNHIDFGINNHTSPQGASSPSGAVVDNEFFDAVGVYVPASGSDPAALKIYVDGVLEGTFNSPNPIASGATFLQFGYEFTGNYSTDLDECFVCDRALNACEVAYISGKSYAQLVADAGA